MALVFYLHTKVALFNFKKLLNNSGLQMNTLTFVPLIGFALIWLQYIKTDSVQITKADGKITLREL